MVYTVTRSTCLCGAGADPGFAKGADHGERGEREPINGVWEQSPQRGLGAEPLVGVRGLAPLKLKAFRLFSYKKGPKI